MVTVTQSMFKQNSGPKSENASTVSNQRSNVVQQNESNSAKTAKVLFDFTRSGSVDEWIEYSDTTKMHGMSKAVLVMQKTQIFQRAVLFTLCNPGLYGLGFAAIRCDISLDVSQYENIVIKCRGHGTNFKYKMLLRHRSQTKDSLVYGQVFSVPKDELTSVKLSLADFKPYYRGRELPLDMYPLDLMTITNIGIKVDNGPYLPDNQAGPSALEIDWIKATK